MIGSQVGAQIDRPYWFVGASWDDQSPKDQTPRFIRDGVWQNGFEDKLLDQVRSMRVGDRIAVKAAYTRRLAVPFDNRGHSVSVMAIKATGTISENLGDGKTVSVIWDESRAPREWYFSTNRNTIWEVRPDTWRSEGLIKFAFDDEPQDVDRYRNEPFWKERFGDLPSPFAWTLFYEELSTKLLAFRDQRSQLMAGIAEIATRVPLLNYLRDKRPDGILGFLDDVCPFTVMGTFNRQITDANRRLIAGELAIFLGVDAAVPTSFEGIPIMNNQNSWFFYHADSRGENDIDLLWEAFAATLAFADDTDLTAGGTFIEAYDRAVAIKGVGWSLTMGLYWCRPWSYPPLDSRTRALLKSDLGIELGVAITGSDYLALMGKLSRRFEEPAYLVHSNPDLSLRAWVAQEPDVTVIGDEGTPQAQVSSPIEEYRVQNIISDGSFVDRAELDGLMLRLREKKNLILQGPPGTGKTWLARRLAYALIGHKNRPDAVRVMQFHPSLSYEDFVRGWRPSGDGKLLLVDGPFMRMVRDAIEDPSTPHIMVIEEINRGNPAQIFGEMLTLIESEKRTPAEALELSYMRTENERVHVPANLFIIGTMNVADRSIALVDLAFRRRFAFHDLQTTLNEPWLQWVMANSSLQKPFLGQVQSRVGALNEMIAADQQLGRQFQIGHSYVTPSSDLDIEDGREWFHRIVATEIEPLLNEYWFDSQETVDKAVSLLEDGW